MGGKVDFIGVRAGWLEERLILTGRPTGEEMERVVGIKGNKSHSSAYNVAHL